MSIKQKNQERLEAWKLRYYLATGIQPTDEKHYVHPCQFCGRPVWRPGYMKIRPSQYICSSDKCLDKLLASVDERIRYIRKYKNAE